MISKYSLKMTYKDGRDYKQEPDFKKIWKELDGGIKIYAFQLEKEPKAVWDITNIQKIRFEDELKRHKSFRRCFDKRYDLTKPFFADLKHLAFGKIENHFVNEIIGSQGIGKTRASHTIMREVFGWDCLSMKKNVSFNYEQTLKKVKQFPKEPFIIQDEQPKQAGMGSDREAFEIQNLIETTRIRRKCLIFISPTTRYHSAVHYRLKVMQRSWRYRILKLAIMDFREMGFIGQYTYEYLGYIVLKIPKDKDDPFYTNSYLPVKYKFVDSIQARDIRRIDFTETAEKLKKHPLFASAKTKEDLMLLSQDQNPTWTELEHRRNAQRFLMLYPRLKARIKKSREAKGVRCKKCGQANMRYSKTRKIYTCRSCGHEQTK